MGIEAVIFDMDGLLIDSERVSQQAFLDTAADYQLGDVHELFLSLVGCNENTHKQQLQAALGHKLDAVQFRLDWIDRYLAALADGIPPLLPGVEDTLRWLHAQGIKKAVATSSGRQAAEKKLAGNGIDHYFSTVTTGDDVVVSKPNPEIFLKAAASIQVDPQKAWALEDSENGVKASVAAGMSVIQVPNLVQPSSELLQLRHRVMPSMNDVLAFFKQLHAA